jgi:preprotein translocase subunit SecE
MAKRKTTAVTTTPAPTTRQGFSARRFFSDIYAELKKVVWLSRREVLYLTGVVLLMAALAGLALGALDLGFTNVVNNFFLR